MSLLFKIAGKIEDLSKKYPDIDVREVASNDPSNTKKYLGWMVKQLDKGTSKQDLYPTVNLFHNLSQRNQLKDLPKSIDEYNSLKELEDKLKNISQESNRESAKKLKENKKAISGLPHIIFENDIFAVTRIDTRAEAIVVGEGTHWCITMSNANYFDYYKSMNVEFYFAILKNKIDNQAYQKLAFDFQRDFNKNIIKETIWLASDSPFENITSEMIEYYGEGLHEAFAKAKSDASSQPNGLVYRLMRDPSAKVQDYLKYKKWSDEAINPAMGEFDNEQMFNRIKSETKSKNLIKYFEDEIKEKVESYEEIDWRFISSSQKLSEDFIREFSDKVDWTGISYHQQLSEDFIREFSNKVDWAGISYHQQLSEDFIREFSNKVDWKNISAYQKLSEDFILKFKNKIHWDKLSHNNIYDVNNNIIDINKYKSLILNNLDKIKDVIFDQQPLDSGIKLENIFDNFREQVLNKKIILDYQLLNFIDKYHGKISRESWESISEYAVMNKEFIKKFAYRLNIDRLYLNDHTPYDELHEFFHDFKRIDGRSYLIAQKQYNLQKQREQSTEETSTNNKDKTAKIKYLCVCFVKRAGSVK